jgi:hypothetical protein
MTQSRRRRQNRIEAEGRRTDLGLEFPGPAHWTERGKKSGMAVYRSTFYIPADELKTLERQAKEHGMSMVALLNEIFQLGLSDWLEFKGEAQRVFLAEAANRHS